MTENPVTVDAGHLQFETDLARHISSKPGAEPRQRTIRADAFAFNMGLSNRTDVQVFVDAYEWNRTVATADQPATSTRGLGDVTLRLKHNLLGNDSTEGPLAVGLIGSVRLPTGSAQGAGGTQFGLRLPATYALSDSWNLSAQLPLHLNFDRDASRHYLEEALNVGPIFFAGKNLQLDFGRHLALTRDADREYFVGLVVRR